MDPTPAPSVVPAAVAVVTLAGDALDTFRVLVFSVVLVGIVSVALLSALLVAVAARRG